MPVADYSVKYNTPHRSDTYSKNQSDNTTGINNPMHKDYISTKVVITKKIAHHRKTYNIWNAMKQRCFNTNGYCYERYGGRGITICDRWLSNYQNFVDDMGEVPHGYSIERIDIDKNYCPENCTWIPKGDQVFNRSITIRILHNGETKLLRDWCLEFNLSYKTIYERYRSGWKSPELFETPIASHKPYKNAKQPQK